MPITWTLDREARLIRVEVRGEVTVAEMIECVTSAADEVGEPGYNIVSDHRQIAAPVTKPQLERLTHRLLALRPVFQDSRWATVVSSPASFGMMRMFAVFLQQVPITLEIFSETADAERWAGGKS